MRALFLTVLNLSINASWLILAVIIARLLLKKAPKWVSCLLWGLVAVRLVCPVSLESALSLLPSGRVVPENIETMQDPYVDFGVKMIDNALNPVIERSFTPNEASAANPMLGKRRVAVFAASVIWASGIAVMLMYALISFLVLKRKVRAAAPLGDRIMECDEIDSPFILGIFKPVIYVPSGINKRTLELVTAHEEAHLKRHDHWWKPIGFVLLSVYWFNPFCWVAYILLCRDIEAACDEKVIRDKDREYMAAYSQALLDLSVQRRIIAACPLAFGETGVKGRIKGVLNYKKPAFWVIALSLIVCIVVAVCFLTSPKDASAGGAVPAEDENADSEQEISSAELPESGEHASYGTVQMQESLEEYEPEAVENLDVDYVYEGELYIVDGDMAFEYRKTLIGRSPNARHDGMYVVLTNDPDITFEMVDRSLYSSNSADHLSGTILIGIHAIDENGNIIENLYNPIGLSIRAKDITPTGCTLVFTQHDGNVTGMLQTGSFFEIQAVDGSGEWKDILPGERVWNDVAFMLESDGITEQKISWEPVYGKLQGGHYRIYKRVMDFRGTGGYSEYDVYAEFNIPDSETGDISVRDWMSIELPQGYSIGEFRDDIGYMGGSLIIPKSYEVAEWNDSAPAEWQYSGLISRISASNTDIEFSRGLPKNSGVPIDNHTTAEYIGAIGLERSTNQWPALMLKVNHDLYTHADLERMKQDGIDADGKFELSADYWEFWFVKEGEGFYYVLTLSAKEFTDKEATDIALEVSIK